MRTDYWFDQTGMTLEDSASDTTTLRDPSGLPLSSYTTTVNNYARDRLGSITALTSTGQALTNTYRYDPWGQILASTGSAPNTLRFTAARRDPTTGYDVMGQRSYDSGVGRFTQADPRPSSITELNRYAYAGCNPTNAIDPTGTQCSTGQLLTRYGAGLFLLAAGTGIVFLGGFVVLTGLFGTAATFAGIYETIELVAYGGLIGAVGGVISFFGGLIAGGC